MAEIDRVTVNLQVMTRHYWGGERVGHIDRGVSDRWLRQFRWSDNESESGVKASGSTL